MIKKAEELSYNSSISLIGIASFSKWEDYGTPRSKLRKVNIRILINGLSDNISVFRRHFQDKIKSSTQIHKYKKPSFKLSKIHQK